MHISEQNGKLEVSTERQLAIKFDQSYIDSLN